MPRFPRLVVAVFAPALLLLTSACVNQRASDSSTCAQPSVSLSTTLPASGPLQPEYLVVCQDQQVTITVTSHRDGALHLHGYDDQNAEVEVSNGADATLKIVASHVGQFVFEVHPADGSAEVQVGTLTVNVR